MNVHEAIEYLENSDVSSNNGLSVDEDFISMGRLVILPPNYVGDRGRDENELLPNNLTGVNLLLVLLLILVHQLSIFR